MNRLLFWSATIICIFTARSNVALHWVLWSLIADICIQIIHQSFSFKTQCLFGIYMKVYMTWQFNHFNQGESFMQSKVVELHVIIPFFSQTLKCHCCYRCLFPWWSALQTGIWVIFIFLRQHYKSVAIIKGCHQNLQATDSNASVMYDLIEIQWLYLYLCFHCPNLCL